MRAPTGRRLIISHAPVAQPGMSASLTSRRSKVQILSGVPAPGLWELTGLQNPDTWVRFLPGVPATVAE